VVDLSITSSITRLGETTGKRPIMATTSTRRAKGFGIAITALAVAGFAAACAGPAPAPAPAPACSGPGGPPDATTSAVYNATNASRAGAGVGGLSWNPQLWCLASEWSAEMGRTGMHHRDLDATIRRPDYSGYTTLGENVLYGPATMSGEEMHDAWMNSPTHRANILSPTFTSFAVATAYPQGPYGQVSATENFGG
jgi:uncharacterized protein YkwD